jgi:DNA-binding response OmpR family regulator
MAADRVLILDDDPVVGLVLVLGVQACGFEAQLCAEPDELLAAVRQGAASHVVVDLSLRQGSGQQVLRQLAALGCRARVVICSGAERAELDNALALAAALGLATAGVLVKPFRQAELRALLLPAAP